MVIEDGLFPSHQHRPFEDPLYIVLTIQTLIIVLNLWHETFGDVDVGSIT